MQLLFAVCREAKARPGTRPSDKRDKESINFSSQEERSMPWRRKRKKEKKHYLFRVEREIPTFFCKNNFGKKGLERPQEIAAPQVGNSCFFGGGVLCFLAKNRPFYSFLAKMHTVKFI